MSAMTFTEDNCGTYPPSYPQRESLRLQRYNKLINCARFLAKKNVVSLLIYMILLTRLPVAGYCDWTFEVGRQSRVGALEVLQNNQLCKSCTKKKCHLCVIGINGRLF